MADPFRKDVIIIGAGASGLFCAAECARRGRSVLVLDHASRPCAKVLVSGGGRCNFTNLGVTAGHYLSANPDFVRSALARFSPADMTLLLKKHRIGFVEKEAGQLFCAAGSRKIAEMLVAECRAAGAEIALGCRVEEIAQEGAFLLRTAQGTFRSESLVVATGGLSYPDLGASGFGHDIARQFRIPVIETRPALVPFTLSAADRRRFSGLAGVSLEAAISCSGRSFRGGMLFTHRGLSGPAALQISSFWRNGLALTIDLFPDADLASLFAANRSSAIEVRNLLGRMLPRRFAETWCSLFFASRPLRECSDRELRSLEEALHAWQLTPAGTEGYRTAEATAGGVDTRAISSKTMEARDLPGLYFIGEVLDVTGELGGYNLHWAWASGHAAGQFA